MCRGTLARTGCTLRWLEGNAAPESGSPGLSAAHALSCFRSLPSPTCQLRTCPSSFPLLPRAPACALC